MNLRERANALGINPDDPRYSTGSTFSAGDTWCSWCHYHAVRNPRVRCDCQQAEAAIIRNNGGEAHACFRCHEPTPEPGSICGECRASEAAKSKDDRRYRRRLSSALYADDAHGCVERVHPTELKILNPEPEPEGF